MRKRIILTLFAAILLFGPQDTEAANAAESIGLKLNLEAGEQYPLRVVVKRNKWQSIMGRPTSSNEVLALGWVFEVLDDSGDGRYTLRATVDNLYLELEGPRGTVGFYSGQPEEEDSHPLAQSYRRLLGRSFTVSVNSLGQVSAVDGVEEIFDDMAAGVESASDTQRENLVNKLGLQFGPEATRELMQRIFGVYPRRPVSKGGSWERSLRLAADLPMTMERSFTLLDFSDSLAVVQADCELDENSEAGPRKMGALEVTIGVSGEQGGVLELDRRTGWIRGGMMKQKMGAVVKVEPDERRPEGIQWPMTVEGEILFERF